MLNPPTTKIYSYGSTHSFTFTRKLVHLCSLQVHNR
jgi:hypothetical protein